MAVAEAPLPRADLQRRVAPSVQNRYHQRTVGTEREAGVAEIITISATDVAIRWTPPGPGDVGVHCARAAFRLAAA